MVVSKQRPHLRWNSLLSVHRWYWNLAPFANAGPLSGTWNGWQWIDDGKCIGYPHASKFMYNFAIVAGASVVFGSRMAAIPPVFGRKAGIYRPVNRGIHPPSVSSHATMSLDISSMSLTFLWVLSLFYPGIGLSRLCIVLLMRPLLRRPRWVSPCVHGCFTVTLGIVAFIAFFCIFWYCVVGDLVWFYRTLCGTWAWQRGYYRRYHWGTRIMANSEQWCVDSIICTHFRTRGCASSVVIGYYYFIFFFVLIIFYVDSVIYELFSLFCVFVYIKPIFTR